jgi:hypothetical protein
MTTDPPTTEEGDGDGVIVGVKLTTPNDCVGVFVGVTVTAAPETPEMVTLRI